VRTERLDLGEPVQVRIVDGGDEVVWSEVWRDDCYGLTPETVGNRVLVDVGANVGMTTLRALSCGASAVLAVEPDAWNFARLWDNLRDNRTVMPRARALNAAAGRVPGMAFLDRDGYRDENYGGAHTAAAQGGDAVPVHTLEELVGWVPADAELVLKVDTEGAEYEILHDDVPAELMRRFAVIVGEFHHFAARNVGGRAALGRLVTKLADTHAVEVFGRPDDGGLFRCRRYASS